MMPTITVPTITAQFENLTERWLKLPSDHQALAAAGLLGRITGRSYAADAISTATLLSDLEIEVREQERNAAIKLAHEIARGEPEADE